MNWLGAIVVGLLALWSAIRNHAEVTAALSFASGFWFMLCVAIALDDRDDRR